MVATAQTDPRFVFRPIPPLEAPVHFPFPLPHPLGPLEPLAGTWQGHGFNTIWRPHFPVAESDRFLELNLTTETLSFHPVAGAIPNRGLLQADINMFGLTYMQQISDSTNGAGLHIEPGIWAVVPPTTDPQEPATVVRLASIPHGTVILAQGTAAVTNGPPAIPDNNIIPFRIGAPPPPNADFPNAERQFPELNLAVQTAFRNDEPGVTQAIVENPNSVLRAALAGQSVRRTITLQVSTDATPVPGGGTANTAFLHQGNANATVVTATFWIETIAGSPGRPDILQLQYSQTVMLDFNGLRWPHVTVATLTRHNGVPVPLPPWLTHPELPRDVVPPRPGPVPERAP